VQVETATFADCHFVEEAVENSERVTKSTVEDLYADGAYQSPENRKFAEDHGGMRLKTGKMQGGARWELVPHKHDDGLTVREIATGKTFEAVKSVNQKGKHQRWRIPWNNKTGWRYFQDTEVEAYQLRKQIESLPEEEQHKRNNVEAAMFQYSFHTRNGKTRYRGLLKHRMQAYARAMWMNLRRVVIFQLSAFQRSIFALFGTLREASGWLVMIFTNIFPARVSCCESPQMTMIVTRYFKNATF
jgi:IS5 family transposase